MRRIAFAGFPDGSFEGAADERHGAVTAGINASAGTFGRYEKRTVLTTASVVIQINGVLYQPARHVGLRQHLSESSLSSFQF